MLNLSRNDIILGERITSIDYLGDNQFLAKTKDGVKEKEIPAIS